MTQSTTAPAPSNRATPQDDVGPIVVAVGGHDARTVLAAARQLAISSGREMVALTVLEPYPRYLTGPEPIILPPSFETERTARRLSILNDQLREAGASGTRWHAEIIHGAPAPALAEAARKRHASMMVMGIGRHRPLDRLLGGETALHAIRHAPCPVLAVGMEPTLPPREVVVATDFGPAGARAAEAVLPLLTSGATVSLVHAWQPAMVEDERLAQHERVYVDGLPEKFARLRETLAIPAGVQVKEIVREGSPAECVLDYAAAHHADLIVAGRRKLSMLSRLAVGSVTTAIIRSATCSVMVAPEPSFADSDRLRRLLTGATESRVPEEWTTQLREFTRRNHGRRVSLEVDDVVIGAQVVESGYQLVAADYDTHTRRVELELGDTGGSARRVVRRMAGVETIAIATDEHGRDKGLRITHGPGQTVLSFME